MRLLVTAGPTVEDIDSVRFVSNRSSGRLGYALAACAVRRGWSVTLLSGPVYLEAPAGLAGFQQVRSAQEMAEAALSLFTETDAVIMAAAVADYRPAQAHTGKLKKSERLVLELVRTVDVLASLGERKQPQQVLVGFALEAGGIDDAAARAEALRKARQKRLEAIVLNGPANIGAGAGSIRVLSPNGELLAAVDGGKEEQAAAVIDVTDRLWREKQV